MTPGAQERALIATVLKRHCTESDDHDSPYCWKCAVMADELTHVVAQAGQAEREACAAQVEAEISEWCRKDHLPRREFCEDYGCSTFSDLAAALRARPTEPMGQPDGDWKSRPDGGPA